MKLLLVSLITIFSFCKKDTSAQQTTDSKYPQYGTPFANVPKVNDAAIYQVNLRAFSADHNFKAVTAKLDEIKSLGINVVYLMPIYPVGVIKSAGGLGSPYSVKDYKGINTEFGNLDDLRQLVDAAHSKGMAVMLDWVANHTSWDNAWTANKSWYKQDANGNFMPPTGTNWSDVIALNFDNKDLRAAMIDAMRYWVYTANIDGYRCDAADFVPLDFWKEANDAMKAITTHKLLMLAEGTRADHFRAGFQMVYGMGYYGNLKNNLFDKNASLSVIQNLNTTEYATALPGSQVVRYTTNHDVYLSDGSPVNIFGGKTGSMAAFLVTSYMKGVPMIYNGQEVGATLKIDFFYNTPIDWSTNPDMTKEYKDILNFRASSDAVKTGDLSLYSSDDVSVFAKSNDKQKVLVIANMRNDNKTYNVPPALANGNWKNAFTNAAITLGNTLKLQPYQHMVLVQ